MTPLRAPLPHRPIAHAPAARFDRLMSLIASARRQDDAEPEAVTDVEFRARVEALVNPQLQQLRAENAQLRAENAQLRAENAHLRAENAHLRAENAQLRDRLERQEERISRLEELLLR